MKISLTYHSRLYLGESISREKLDKIKKRLAKNPLLAGVFLIAVSKNSSDQLDIYDAKQLAQRYYRNNPPHIVGIAGNRQEALELVEQLVRECMASRGDCALKEYLL